MAHRFPKFFGAKLLGTKLLGAKLVAAAMLLGAVGLFGLVGAFAPANAADLFPMIPKAKAGTSCVEDPAFMRLNHMDLLKHQRDDTLREGIRGGRHALKECISCHEVTGASGSPVTVDSPEHFCKSCHTYAAVTVDCFSCHASVPDKAETQASRAAEAMPAAVTQGETVLQGEMQQ